MAAPRAKLALFEAIAVMGKAFASPRRLELVVVGDACLPAAALGGRPAPRVVDEHLAHEAAGDREELHPLLPEGYGDLYADCDGRWRH